MNSYKLLPLVLLVSIAFTAVCQHSLASRFAAPNLSSTSAGNSSLAPANIVDKEYVAYREQARQKFRKKDFAWLDKEARKVRVSKERMPGGYWKLRVLYAGLEEPGDNASDGDWEDLLNGLRDWAQQHPDSVTARVALASAWKKYAWKARGPGFAGSVSDTAWEVFGRRLDTASQALTEASALKERCPYWYETALWVGIGQNWDRERLDKIFDAGVQLEPTFYYLYQTKATYLLPRWGGTEGQWEKFADASALKLGGNQGDIVFFAIYSQMLAVHGHELMNNHQQVVPKLIAGFRSIEKLYGTSTHRLNEVCFFACFGNDIAALGEFFKRVNEDTYDDGVWHSKQNFDIYRRGFEQRAKSAQLPAANMPRPANQGVSAPQN